MRLISIAFAFFGLFSGIIAAIFWLKASKIEANPVWGDREPLDPVQAQASWIAGTLTAATESGRLNSIAAKWTAAAVVLSTTASVTGLFI